MTINTTLPRAADIVLPSGVHGFVIFAHGSGSSRFSPRNRHVASQLNRAGYGTILFDLLTEEEVENRANVFDIPLLGRRLEEAIKTAHRNHPSIPIGLFGASTGAAAALHAAARQPDAVKAIVSRGGRPDLAADVLHLVQAPTLLIVGEWDEPVIEMNREALARLRCTKKMEIVPGATHLFEELGTLDRVVALAIDWFDRYLKPNSAS